MNMQECRNQTALVLTVSPWDEPKRLRKQIAEVLALDLNVIYVTLPYGVCKPFFSADRTEGNVRILSFASPPIPMRLLGMSPVFQWIYELLLSWRLKRKLRSVGEIKTVFCFTQMHSGLLARFPKNKVVYIANDDHASMAQDEATAVRILRDEERAIACSARVVSVSEVIARKLVRFGRPVHVMYPGHNCAVLPLSRFTGDIRLPRSACFFGYIDWRVDFVLLAFMLEQGWSIDLIGKEVGTAKQIHDLKSQFCDRFNVYSPVPVEDAPELLARYQVLIIPYRYRNASQAEVMELPNKTFVYFCALRPIVTTWMPNLKLVEPGLIYRARTNAEFIECCERAVEEDSESHAVRRSQLAKQNTWGARRATLRELIDGTAIPLEEDEQ